MWSAAGNHAKAAAYFAEIARPKEAGEHLEKLGKKSEAIDKYVEALSLLTTGASRDKQLRPGERDIGVEAESKELFAKICKLFDEQKDWDRYAKFLLKQERPDAAAEVFRKAGDLPRAAELLREARHWDAAGRLMQEMGKEKEALVLFAQARQERNELDKAAELYLQAASSGSRPRTTRSSARRRPPPRSTRSTTTLSARPTSTPRSPTTRRRASSTSRRSSGTRPSSCHEQLDEFAKVAECWEKAGNFFLAGVTWFTQRETLKAIGALKRSRARARTAARRRVSSGSSSTRRARTRSRSRSSRRASAARSRRTTLRRSTTTPRRSSTCQGAGKAISAYETIQKLPAELPGHPEAPRRAQAREPLPKTSIYADGQDDPGSLFHTSRFSLRGGSKAP